ncbi:hypothetical protein EV210_103324 [Anaerospora hongkongensis]|uniref:Uncharacterized protein n=1 Tax=Anaerospora hongkongensis TaxID=244830 RepID=A0A4R1Q2Q7_9FIRM|nr:hypothetical protein [Anaerospora hongkongensis]TCL38840.1 hypothetical protein EV210_103324 [Anaerospora hongkongensis]
MNLDILLVTIDAVLDALPEDIDKEHPERLKFIRDILGLVLTVRKLNTL